jgi:hypothetical protein
LAAAAKCLDEIQGRVSKPQRAVANGEKHNLDTVSARGADAVTPTERFTECENFKAEVTHPAPLFRLRPGVEIG